MINVRRAIVALAVISLCSQAGAQYWPRDPWRCLYLTWGSAAVVVVHPRDRGVLALTWDSLVSSDGGQTWASMGQAVREGWEFAFDSGDPTAWYLVTWGDEDDPGKQLVRVTWASGPVVDAIADRATFDGGIPAAVAVRPDNPQVVYVGTSRGTLYRSRDRAVSWQRVLSAGSGNSDQESFGTIHLASPSAIVVRDPVRRDCFYRSVDDGITWEVGGAVLGATELQVLAVHPEDPDLLFVWANYWEAGRSRSEVLQSSDGGATWLTLLDVYGERPSTSQFAVDPDDRRQLAVASSDTVLLSDNGGVTWSRIGALPSVVVPDQYRPNSVAFDGQGRLLVSTKTALLYLQLPLTPTSIERAPWARIKSHAR